MKQRNNRNMMIIAKNKMRKNGCDGKQTSLNSAQKKKRLEKKSLKKKKTEVRIETDETRRTKRTIKKERND